MAMDSGPQRTNDQSLAEVAVPLRYTPRDPQPLPPSACKLALADQLGDFIRGLTQMGADFSSENGRRGRWPTSTTNGTFRSWANFQE